ncbi:uncharacterized protein PHACADRAFT_197481 [Phanerochaete carnosa HHB-10118-sp]|uniref:Uncharacterized protein n=1 Tax=Phanerochaete carnosa (strain HHB-10118-sp) TaxID=650164 RepID=K5USX9_PHACS|nr:uncharacterized protein PHACADRAFT_197481 [Phanerochaete carnosa HHB-10118-sp]EKM53051.1 hypothetical protein PHACADRAFT_197481 [Phanerochaete carnosa HHB-10118-sp]
MSTSSVRSGGTKGVKKSTFVKLWEHRLCTTATAGEAISKTLGRAALAKEKARVEEQIKKALTRYSQDTINLLRQGTQEEQPMDIDLAAQEDLERLGINQDGVNNDMPAAPKFQHAIRDVLQLQWKLRWYKQTRQWHQQRMCEEAAWSLLLNALADQFLRWKYPASNSPPKCSPSRAESTVPWSTETHFTLIDDTHARSPQPIDESVRLPYCIKTYDIFTLQNEITVFHPADSTSPAFDLLEHGYIVKTPRWPEVAVSVKMLDLLYRLCQ